ncbi:ATP-binding protein [Rhodoferax sp.]|uniref:sensor histidine kinase n=1 Tax=Rhodoferax sp. TaxID=50421 RepID=UPI0025D2DE66|nr:ATP-binding protein [Rhodoferax sp.]
MSDLEIRLADVQARLQQSEARNIALQAELEHFVRNVSHDLRAPLRHITAYAPLVREMLAEGEDPAPCLDTLEQSARSMARMVDALLELSRLSRIPLQRAAVSMAALVAEAQRALAADAVGRSIQWQLPADWPEVQGDAALLRQVWEYALSNALKFTRTRTQAQITLGWEHAADGITFWLRDNGVGFNPASSANMFDLFQRLHTTSAFEGAGVGLALARQIVHRHDGSMAAQGVVDGGCTLRFTLPMH